MDSPPWPLRVLVLVGLVATELFLLQHTPYRPDVDVYRMGAQAWLDGHPLYSDSALFHTRIGMDLPFTYPPLAVVVLCPLAWLSQSAAVVVVTVVTLLCLVVSLAILLARLDVRPPAHALWLAAAIAVPCALLFEPIRANFSFGQINVVLMTLVIADCVPRRTPWPRGVLLGIAIALKLTPAVFLLYFALRRDGRAVLVSVVSFLVGTCVGFAFAWRDSWTYWTSTVRNTGRIGVPSLRTNQNLTAVLARFDLGSHARVVLWAAAGVAVLILTVWAVRRLLRAQQPMLALMCVALFGLVVSPVSWTHHWVWMVPTVLVTGLLAYQKRSTAMAFASGAGAVLMLSMPFLLMPKDREPTAALWRQLVGSSYVWWALAVIAASGVVAGRRP